MVIDERSRHGLYLKLEQVLGQEEATTLMEHLPPIGWADVATKQDLDQLRAAMDQIRAAMDQLRVDVAQQFQTQELAITAIFRGELIALQKHMVFAMMGLMVSVAALAFAIGQFI